MRRATSLIHTSEIKILLNLPFIFFVLIFVDVKTYIDHVRILFLGQVRGEWATYLLHWSVRATWMVGARGHHVGDP